MNKNDRYSFKSYKNGAIVKILKTFDEQIKREYKINNGVKERCVSYWNKILFIDSLYLTPYDWRIIRDRQYWEEKKRLTQIESVKYTIDRIKEYQQKNKH